MFSHSIYARGWHPEVLHELLLNNWIDNLIGIKRKDVEIEFGYTQNELSILISDSGPLFH